jgi:Cu-processing system permease protein
MTPVRIVARWDARAVLRDRWFVAVAAAYAVLTLAAAVVALSSATIFGVSSFGRSAAALIQLTMLFVPLLSLTVGAGWIAAERESGALALIACQPITRNAIFAGKYVGVAWTVIGATVLGFGAAGMVLATRSGADQLPAFLLLVGLAILLSLAMLSVGFAVSAAAPSRSRALATALLLWLGFVIVSDLGVLGTAVVLRLPAPIVLLLGSVNPVSAFRLAAIVGITGNADLTGPVGQFAADRFGVPMLVGALTAVLAAWTAGAYLVGRRRFGRSTVL